MKSKLLPHTDGQGLIAKGGADQERNADMYGLIWALVFRRANTEQMMLRWILNRFDLYSEERYIRESRGKKSVSFLIKSVCTKQTWGNTVRVPMLSFWFTALRVNTGFGMI